MDKIGPTSARSGVSNDARARVRTHGRSAPPSNQASAGPLLSAAAAAFLLPTVPVVAKGAIDAVRVQRKLPEATAAGRRHIALYQMALAQPTTTIIDPRAPAVPDPAAGGRSFTEWDARWYRRSMALGVGIAVAQALASTPGLASGLGSNGPSGLYDSKSGRAGTLQAVGGGATVLVVGKAVQDARAAQVVGARAVARSVMTSPLLSLPAVAGVGFAAMAAAGANWAGAFNFLNRPA